MLLRTVEYLDQALEYDRLAREATKRSDKTKYANLAVCYRYLAHEQKRYLTQTPPCVPHRRSARSRFGGLG